MEVPIQRFTETGGSVFSVKGPEPGRGNEDVEKGTVGTVSSRVRVSTSFPHPTEARI